MLDVKRLRILREVAQHGSFSAAADALYLSQSAVSQQVATLEREVGMKLFDRTREGPKLTDAGRVLVSHADAAIARLEEAERELAAIAGLEGGELRLASFPSASATVLTEAVSIFHRRYPRVRLSVVDAEPEDSLPRLRARRARPRAELRLSLGPAAERARPRPHPAAQRIDVPGAARAITRSPRCPSCRWPSSRTSSGCADRGRRAAARSSSAPAATPVSSLTSGSSPTTTT